jgi:poly(3-hydroxybutyrate) depolymerase
MQARGRFQNSRASLAAVTIAMTLASAALLIGSTRPQAARSEAASCLADKAAGDHTYQCDGFRVDARIPSGCTRPGCGLILEVHGDTGTGLLADGHTKLRELGAQFNYIVVMPTGPPFGHGEPGSTWTRANDATLVDIVQQFTRAFQVDPKKIHVTGFSRGGFVTWRLLCDHADLFASAAPAAAGAGLGEVTCFTGTRVPSRKIPILFLMGRTDHQVSYNSMVNIRDAAIANYAARGPQVLAQDANYSHNRWTGVDGAIIETFDHAYETVKNGPWDFALGHCVPGSQSDPQARQYAVPCKLPNAFAWGDEVMRFFRAHPKT